jgi:hypothetical protein
MPTDWTVPVNDALCNHLRCCTLCGRRDGQKWLDIFEGPPPLAVAFVECERCRTRDPQRAELAALLERRYGQGVSRGRESS